MEVPQRAFCLVLAEWLETLLRVLWILWVPLTEQLVAMVAMVAMVVLALPKNTIYQQLLTYIRLEA